MAKLSGAQKQAYREGYRLGLYAGGQLSRLGIYMDEPRESKRAERNTGQKIAQ